MQSNSVLMSVYYKEKPEYLKESVQSMFNQTLTTDDFVLVCEGHLTDELDSVIDGMKQLYPDVLKVIRLNENKELGCALNVGLNHVKMN